MAKPKKTNAQYEPELNAAISEARQKYVAAVEGGEPEEVTRPLSDLVQSGIRGLANLLARGAKPCQVCKGAPIGMRKNDREYEVGCLGCQDRYGRGPTAEAAAAAWNEVNG